MKHNHVTFEATIIAINYNGSGKDKVIGSFQYGWNNNGANAIHNGVIMISPTISNTSREVISKQYPNYKFFGEK